MVWLAQPRARPRVGAEKQFTLLAEKQLLGGQDGQLHQGAEWIMNGLLQPQRLKTRS